MDIYETQPDWKTRPWIVGLLVVIFFPLGLYLVWKHPVWQTKTKWIITGAFLAVLALSSISHEARKADMVKKLKKADEQWATGQKLEAVTFYKLIEGEHWVLVDDESKPKILTRIVEFHADLGQNDEAKRWVSTAKRRKVSVTSQSPKVASLLANVEDKTTTQSPSDSKNESQSGFELGNDFRLGDYKYKIVSVEQQWQIGQDVFGTFMGEKTGSGAIFVIVTYTIENCTNESQVVLADDFTLIDAQGRKFGTSSKVSTALLLNSDDKDFLLSELQPGLPRQMQQGFELPTKSVESTLTVVVPKKGLLSWGEARITAKVQ